jgi:hypothetical protein
VCHYNKLRPKYNQCKRAMQKSPTKKTREEENLPPMRGKKKGIDIYEAPKGARGDARRRDRASFALDQVITSPCWCTNQPSRQLLFILAKSGSERLGVENRILIKPKSRTQPKTSPSYARSWKCEEQVTNVLFRTSVQSADTFRFGWTRKSLCEIDRHTNLLAMENMG